MGRNNRNSNKRMNGSSSQRTKQNQSNGPKTNQNNNQTRTNSHARKLRDDQSLTETPAKPHWCSSCRAYSSDPSHKNERSWDCPRNPKQQGRQQRVQNNQTKCSVCGKSNHSADQCHFKSTKTAGNANANIPKHYNTDISSTYTDLDVERYYNTPREYTSSEERYCVFCNVNGHIGLDCQDSRKVMDHKRSKLKCRLCGSKGHLADDCRCPLARRCEKCAKPGHPTDSCQTNNDADVYSQFTKRILLQQDHTGQRFKWDNGSILPNKAQEMRQMWELYQLHELQAGRFVSKEQDDRVLGEIEDMERAIFESSGQAEPGYAYSVPALIRHSSRGSVSGNGRPLVTPPTKAPPRPGNIGKIQFSATPIHKGYTPSGGLLSKGPTHNPKINRFLTQGMTPEDIVRLEEAAFKVQEEKVHHAAQRIRAKINASRHLYKHEHVTSHLQRKIGQLEYRGNSASNVHLALVQGALFYRDPKAIEALFARQVPRCGICHTEGRIFDGDFNYIHPATRASDLLGLNDEAQWGIFVGFDCEGQCSKKGYWFHNAYDYKFADVDTTDPEYQKW